MTTLTQLARPKVAAGAAVFLAGSVLVHAGNYVFNLLAVRFLRPADYADLALTVTLLLLAGFITVGFQLATARSVAEGGDDARAGERIASWFARRAFRIGIFLGALLAVAAPGLAALFETTSALPFLAVAGALPWAFDVGVGRGAAQGARRFGRLAWSFHVEMLVRLGLGAGLMAAGFGVAGAIGGLTLSVIAAAVAAGRPAAAPAEPDVHARSRLLATLWPAMALLVGEALVNHVDTLVVKQGFDPTTAGQFAAVALIGRSVFFVTWPISMLVFPIAARRSAEGASTRSLLWAAVGAVASVGAVATAAAACAPAALVEMVLGAEYVAQAHLLAPYVAATGLFSCAATIVSFHMATGLDAAGLASAAAGLATVLVLAVFHGSLSQVVWAQVVIMAVYAAAAAMWAHRRSRVSP